MGCCASAEEDYTPPGTGATEDGSRLVLTSKGAANAIYFENVHALRESEGAILTLRSGMAVVPRFDYPRKHEEWSYITLGLGPRDMAMRVRLDGDFLVRVHDERVFDVCWWKYEVGNHLLIIRSTACHPSRTRLRADGDRDGGRSFLVNSDGTISPKCAQHLVLGAGKPCFSFVPEGSPLVCRFQHAAALAAGQQVPLTLASHPGLAVVQRFDARVPADEWQLGAFHDWHYKGLGIGPASEAVVASRQGSFFVDKAGWYVCPSNMNIHPGNHTDLVVNRFNHPARILEEHRRHSSKRPLCYEFHDDGSVAPASAPHLRLGCSNPPLYWLHVARVATEKVDDNETPTPKPVDDNETPTPKPVDDNETPTPKPVADNETPTPKAVQRTVTQGVVFEAEMVKVAIPTKGP